MTHSWWSSTSAERGACVSASTGVVSTGRARTMALMPHQAEMTASPMPAAMGPRYRGPNTSRHVTRPSSSRTASISAISASAAASLPRMRTSTARAMSRRPRLTRKRGDSGTKMRPNICKPAGTTARKIMSRQLPASYSAWPMPSATRMPMVMLSWYAITRPPRCTGGASSAMNMGVTAEVTPMAAPMMMRPMMSSATLRARKEARMLPTMKSTPLMRMVRRRPMRSAGMPARSAPTTAPSRRTDTTMPSIDSERPNSSLMSGSLQGHGSGYGKGE